MLSFNGAVLLEIERGSLNWEHSFLHLESRTLYGHLSLGQTDRQVVPSGRRLNLRRDLSWVAKRLASFFASTHKSQKQDILRRPSSILLANNRLMDVTQLALTWVGWPNGEKLASTCVQIWSRPKWTQVIASQRKCTQALTKRSRKLTQVFNLRQLASPFDQGFKATKPSTSASCSVYRSSSVLSRLSKKHVLFPTRSLRFAPRRTQMAPPHLCRLLGQ